MGKWGTMQKISQKQHSLAGKPPPSPSPSLGIATFQKHLVAPAPTTACLNHAEEVTKLSRLEKLKSQTPKRVIHVTSLEELTDFGLEPSASGDKIPRQTAQGLL